jgi:Calpain family cysteine protease
VVPEKLRPNEVRSNVGVRNPYSLAEAILLKRGVIEAPIPWRKLPAETAKAYLFKAFHVTYNQLFDPGLMRGKAPLYRGMPGPAGKEKTGGGPCVCTPSDWIDDEDRWKFPPAPPPAPSPSCGSGPFGCDIMQGCVADCYFIASLAAVAWTLPASLTGKAVKNPTPPPPILHNYKFMDSATGATLSANLERNLPVDQFRNLVYAKPTNNRCVWPSLYEKAYAVVMRQQNPGKPNICVLDFGNAATALQEIVRKAVGTTFTTDPTWFTTIKGGCDPATGRATKPMVTWTYPGGTATPNHDEYTDDLIVANHSYTILGTCQVDGSDCIVLRNPYGISFADPVKPGIAEWDCVNGKPRTPLSTSTPNNPPVHPADGNFAMEKGAFARYFEAFCYTQ